MTADRDFLFWLHERLIHKYGESEHTDFVLKVKAIAHKTPPEVDTYIFEPRGRFYLLGETSTIGPRWQTWDDEVCGAVITGIDNEAIGNQFVTLLNLFNQELKRAQAKEEQPA